MLCQFLYKEVNQQYVHISPPPIPPLLNQSHPSMSSESTVLSSLYYPASSHQLSSVWQCIYVNPNLSIHLLHLPHMFPHIRSLHHYLYSCKQAHLYYFARVHIYVLICAFFFLLFFLTYFTLYNRLQVHPCLYKSANFILFCT